MEISIKVIQFPEANPLPYVPAFCEWTDHVKVCVQCAHVDQLAQQQARLGPVDTDTLFRLLCEGGAQLQVTVDQRIHQQHEISMRN